MLCATAKGQGSAAVVNRICQGNSAGACAMGRVALLRAPRPHGRAPLPHGRGEFVGLPDSSFGRCGSCARGWSPAPARRAWGHLRPTGACGPRCALFFSLPRGGARHASAKPAPIVAAAQAPIHMCRPSPEFMYAFGGAGNNTQGRQPLGLARSTVKPHKPGGSVNTLDAGWQPRRHDQLRTPAHV